MARRAAHGEALQLPNGETPPYCADFRTHISSTIKAGVQPVATAEEAAAAAESAAEEGLDRLVLRWPSMYRHNKKLYEQGHKEVCCGSAGSAQLAIRQLFRWAL